MLSKRMSWRHRLSIACAAAAVMLVGASTTQASAGSATATITSGTGTVFMTKTYINQMAAGNVLITAQTPISVSDQGTYTTTIWNTSGGNADFKTCTGEVDLHGGSLVQNTVTGAGILLDDLRLDLTTDALMYTAHLPTGDVTIEGLKLAGVQGGYVHGSSVTYSASQLLMTAVGAQDLNTVTGTNAFTADAPVFGAFTTSFQLDHANSSSGHVNCG